MADIPVLRYAVPDGLAPGALIRVPAGYRKRPYCLLVTKVISVSQETGALTIQGHVRALDGTTTRRRPLYRVTVIMPDRLVIVAPAPDDKEAPS